MTAPVMDVPPAAESMRLLLVRSLSSAGRAGLIYGLVTIAVSVLLFPFYWTVAAAFKRTGEVTAYPPVWAFTPTLDNFKELFQALGAMGALINSLVIVGVSTCLALLFGSMAAYALARFEIKGKDMIALDILLIRMLPPIVSVIPLFLLAVNSSGLGAAVRRCTPTRKVASSGATNATSSKPLSPNQRRMSDGTSGASGRRPRVHTTVAPAAQSHGRCSMVRLMSSSEMLPKMPQARTMSAGAAPA